MVGYSSLTNYYETMFALRQHHKYDDRVIEEWIPYERDIYIDMLLQFLEKERLELKQRKNQ